jgi:hypothetical protein
LLPESNESFESYYEEIDLNEEEHFPWPSLIITITFALILLIEKIGPTHSHIEHSSHPERSKKKKVLFDFLTLQKNEIQIPDHDN